MTDTNASVGSDRSAAACPGTRRRRRRRADADADAPTRRRRRRRGVGDGAPPARRGGVAGSPPRPCGCAVRREPMGADRGGQRRVRADEPQPAELIVQGRDPKVRTIPPRWRVARPRLRHHAQPPHRRRVSTRSKTPGLSVPAGWWGATRAGLGALTRARRVAVKSGGPPPPSERLSGGSPLLRRGFSAASGSTRRSPTSGSSTTPRSGSTSEQACAHGPSSCTAGC